MRKFIRKLNKTPKYVQYTILCMINVVFYLLMSIPAMTGYSAEARPLIAMIMYIAWLGFALSYGFFSIEIADSVVLGNLLIALFGGIFCFICGNDILQVCEAVYPGEKFVRCTLECLKYSLGAMAVSFVGKNTR